MACSPGCAITVAQKAQEKRRRKEQREARERIKTRSQWLTEAQTAVNSWIRYRDRNLPCVSCGRWHEGQWHAGHYRPAGNVSALRFDEANIHRQCAPCNSHKSGDLVDYRLGLLERIGEAEVDRLERDYPPKRWEIEELKEIRDTYRKKLREMKR